MGDKGDAGAVGGGWGKLRLEGGEWRGERRGRWLEMYTQKQVKFWRRERKKMVKDKAGQCEADPTLLSWKLHVSSRRHTSLFPALRFLWAKIPSRLESANEAAAGADQDAAEGSQRRKKTKKKKRCLLIMSRGWKLR